MNMPTVIILAIMVYGMIGVVGMEAIQRVTQHPSKWDAFYTTTSVFGIGIGIWILYMQSELAWLLGPLLIAVNLIGLYMNGSKVVESYLENKVDARLHLTDEQKTRAIDRAVRQIEAKRERRNKTKTLKTDI